MKIEPMPEGTGALIARMAADDRQAASELASSESAGPAKVVDAVATGSGSVSSNEVLQEAEEYEREATRLQEIADVADNTTYFKTHCARKAARKRLCAEVLIRHAASMTERQPSPNNVIRP